MQEDKLYGIAMECAKHNGEGCDCDCGKCQLNVFNYVRDVRDGALIKATAYTDYQNRMKWKQEIESQKTVRVVSQLIIIAVIIGLIVWGCRACPI